MKLFTAKTIVKVEQRQLNFRAGRWNKGKTKTFENVGNVQAFFQTEQVADRLQMSGPGRGNVDSGFIATNPNSLAADAGATFNSNGTGDLTVTVTPSPGTARNIFSRLLGRNQNGGNTVWTLTLVEQSQTVTEIDRVMFLGIIPVKRTSKKISNDYESCSISKERKNSSTKN